MVYKHRVIGLINSAMALWAIALSQNPPVMAQAMNLAALAG
ncbi:hypothetical protein [Cylindrospermum sp. FACHB-282]|nr:hypothetical protein [Cylindrospermum sp. FACHB-282]